MARQVADLGLVVGAKGEQGERGIEGPRGISAFQAAVQEGYDGTEQALYASLAEVGLISETLKRIIGEDI